MSEEEINIEQLNVAANALKGLDQSMDTEQANEILCAFKVHPNAFLYTKDIVESEADIVLKNTAFQALKICVDTRWKCIEPEVREQIKVFLVEYILGNTDPANPIIKAATNAFISILNQIFPKDWYNFINDFLDMSIEEPVKLANCFDFLTSFFESVSDSADNVRTYSRSNSMVTNIRRNGVKRILELIREILTSQGDDIRLTKSSLSLLAISVKWTYPYDLFKSDIFTTLSEQFLMSPVLALDTVPVLDEVAKNIVFPDEESQCIAILFSLIMNALNSVVEANGQLTRKVLIDFITTLTTYFDHYGYIIDNPVNHDQFINALQFAWNITEDADDILFDLCIEFWHPICNRLSLQVKTDSVSEGYLEYAPKLRRLLIAKMVTPYEIVENIDEFGRNTKRFTSSDSESEYKNMRQCLAILTQIDNEDTQQAINERYSELIESEFDAKQMDSLCWAIAATAGTFPPDVEQALIPEIIDTFIAKVSESEDGDEIDVYARGIAFICSQYFKLLIQNEEFFYKCAMTIVNYIGNSKEIELLQLVCLDTLKFFSSNRQCRQLLIKDIEEEPSIFKFLLENIGELFDAISPDGLVTFVTIICNLAGAMSQGKQEYVGQIIEVLNTRWAELVSSPDPSNPEQNTEIINIANYLTRIPVAQPEIFAGYLQQNIPQYIDLITRFSAAANELISQDGDVNMLQSIKAVKAAIIGIVYKYASFAQPDDILPIVTQDFCNTLMTLYSESAPDARVPQTVSFFSLLMVKLEQAIEPMLQDILAGIYGPSLDMIKDDLDAFPEFRPEIFQMMSSLVHHCSFYINSLTVDQLNEFAECLKWGCQHPQPEISTYCFTILKDLTIALFSIQNQETDAFFRAQLFPEIVVFAFQMLADVTYKFAINQESDLIFFLIKNERFTEHCQEIIEEVTKMFEDQDPSVVATLFQKIIGCTSEDSAKNVLLDFLVLVREISPYDPQLKRAEADAKLRIIKRELEHVPGLVSPADEAMGLERQDSKTEDFLNHLKNMNFKKN